MKVRQIMTTDVECAEPDSTLQEIASMMKEENVGSIPVVDEDELCGIITDRDIVVRCVAEGKDPGECTADEILSEELHSIEPDADVETASRIMAERQVRRLPVVQDGHLVGMISLGDIAVKHGDDAEAGETLQEVSQGVKQPRAAQARVSGRQSAGKAMGGRQQHLESEGGRHQAGKEGRARPSVGTGSARSGEVDREIETGGRRQGISNQAAGREQARQSRVVPIRGEHQKGGGGKKRKAS
jgi:CBS domain-containing protein